MHAINQKTCTLAAYETKRNQMVRHAASHLRMRLLLVALLGSSKDYYCGNELPSRVSSLMFLFLVYIGHGVNGWTGRNHKLVYKNQFKHPSWKRTTDFFKRHEFYNYQKVR